MYVRRNINVQYLLVKIIYYWAVQCKCNPVKWRVFLRSCLTIACVLVELMIGTVLYRVCCELS